MPELNRSLNQPRNMSTSTLPVAPAARYSQSKEAIIRSRSSHMREESGLELTNRTHKENTLKQLET